MPEAGLNFVEAYRAGHPVQAHAIKFALEDAGIPVMIENEALQDAIGDFPCGWSSAPRLMVPDSQFEHAREIIHQTDRSDQSDTRLSLRETATAGSAAMLGILGVALVADMDSRPEPIESTHCLACQTVMDESEESCAKCGWSYAQTDELELCNDEPDDCNTSRGHD